MSTPLRQPAEALPCAEPVFGPAPRRNTRQVKVGGVAVGGDAPVVVQSMTNTDTADVAATTKQVADLWRAGSELVRVTADELPTAKPKKTKAAKKTPAKRKAVRRK